jgi:acetyl esterase/lipase
MNKIRFNSKNFLELHLLKNDTVAPIVLIAPGGGYTYTSDREAMPIVKVVNDAGFHAGIVYYREEMLTYPDTIDEMYLFVKHLREHLEELKINNEIYLIGFSAGGHYVASYAVNHHLYGELGKIDKQVLVYPVLTGQVEFYHSGSLKALLGEDSEKNRDIFSLETKVTKDTPMTFIVHTFEDNNVMIENSMLFAKALRENSVAVEAHFYQSGPHGLSLATEEISKTQNDHEYAKKYKHFSSWANLAMSWLKEK